MAKMVPELVHDCPRCHANRITFVVRDALLIRVNYNWQRVYEAFCICKRCLRSVTFFLEQDDSNDSDAIERDGPLSFADALDNHYRVTGHLSLKDTASRPTPEHTPENVEPLFHEAAVCLTVQAWNAAAVMCRTCIDVVTRPMLPDGDAEGLNGKTRRDLGLRLPWLFDKGLLPRDLRGLSSCIQQDGNDGAHQGNLTKADAEDVMDFTEALLERLFTEPKRLELAELRRAKRREKPE